MTDDTIQLTRRDLEHASAPSDGRDVEVAEKAE
jgi:hypothetical protein